MLFSRICYPNKCLQLVKLNRIKGELAHRLVKQIYGRTNKCEATKQIGQHVRRLEWAQLTQEQPKKKRGSEMQGFSNDDCIEQDLDGHYQILNSRNDPINIYTYVHAHQDDPAFMVHPSMCIA